MKKRRRLWKVGLMIGAILAGLAGGRVAARLVFNDRVERSMAPDAKPVAVVRGTTRHLGTIPGGAITKADFPITNAGSRRLILLPDDDCCGGSEPGQEIIIEPGQGRLLSVEIDTSDVLGKIHQTARYQTNDPALPKFTLTVEAVVRADAAGS